MKTRTTIVADDALLIELRGLAQKRKVSFSEIVRCALVDYVTRKAGKGRKPTFLGIGASGGDGRVSERAEDLLFEEKRGR